MKRKIALLFVGCALTGCSDNLVTNPNRPIVPEGKSLAYVTVSNTHPAQGSVIVITVNSTQGAGVEALGSFAARLVLGRGLEFVSEHSLAEGTRVVREQDGVVLAAGAAPSGFAQGHLFSIDARVVDPSAVSSLALSLTEANGVGFSSRLKSLQVDNAIYAAAER